MRNSWSAEDASHKLYNLLGDLIIFLRTNILYICTRVNQCNIKMYSLGLVTYECHFVEDRIVLVLINKNVAVIIWQRATVTMQFKCCSFFNCYLGPQIHFLSCLLGKENDAVEKEGNDKKNPSDLWQSTHVAENWTGTHAIWASRWMKIGLSWVSLAYRSSFICTAFALPAPNEALWKEIKWQTGTKQ